MGTLKDGKDRMIGVTKEKLGELTHNSQLEAKGKQQKELAHEHQEMRRERIQELEDEYEEKRAQIQDATQEHVGRGLTEKKYLASEYRDKDRLEIERQKHLTGEEDKPW
ncbi:MAG: CsbD family protein [Enterococcus sp.]